MASRRCPRPTVARALLHRHDRRRVTWAVSTGAAVLLSGCATAASPSFADQRNPLWTYDCGGIVRGDTKQRRLALIFTGGEHGEGTAHILDVLSERGIPASFFVTGQYLAQPEYRALARRMVADGHYVGPHSDTHPLYCAWDDRARTLVTEEFFRKDLEKNIADLRQLGALRAGIPVYFIPPYEWFNEDQVRWARKMGVVLFNFTPGSGSNRDWIPEEQRGFVPSATIRRDILAYERRDPHGLNGFLLLLHLGSQRRDKMHGELAPLLDELAARGYEFVRVDELLR